MNVEIERKYLVRTDRLPRMRGGVAIRQAYFPVRGGVGRVRIAGRRAWLTVKGPSRGLVRREIESAVTPNLARELLRALCGPAVIVKTRHRVRFAGRTWEIDIFGGANRGLVLAEVELERASARVTEPPWVGPEVSADRRFANSALATRPFRAWPDAERAAALALLRPAGRVTPDRRRRRATA